MSEIRYYKRHPSGYSEIIVPPAMIEEFKQMVRRAINTWQDCTPEMRDFADRVLEREVSMGRNMKWELPVEDAYELAKLVNPTSNLDD